MVLAAAFGLLMVFNSSPGIGHVAVGMHDERGWRATFYTTGMEHSPPSATGTGWAPTPWHATQRAAWWAMNSVEHD